MEHEKHKRKASSNADDPPDPKIQAIDEGEEEYVEGEGEEEYVEGEDEYVEVENEVYPYLFRLPQLELNYTVLQCFFEAKYSELLAQKVIDLPQLKPNMDYFVHSLKRVHEEDFEVEDFASKVNDLHNCSHFIMACAETCYEENDLICDMEIYLSRKEAHVRRERLLKDDFLSDVLKAEDYFTSTRGILCVLLAYWGNDDFLKKVRIGMSEVNKRPENQALSYKHMKVDDTDVAKSVEGSKEDVV